MEVAVDVSKLSLEDLFHEFQKVPDYDRFPLPEVFYEHFKIKKPQPQTVNEAAWYQPPACLWLGDGKPDIRGPAPGGVRELEPLPALPVEVLTEDGKPMPKALPPPKYDADSFVNKINGMLDTFELKAQTVYGNPTSFETLKLSLPKAETKIETQPE